jgi:2-keto-3-deoxy-L-rhamnonate aldolase RhmA
MKPSFHTRLGSGAPLVGTVIACRDPSLAEMAGGAFDLGWIDLEHSAIDVSDVPTLAIALQAAGCAALVRLPASRFERLSAVLDAGVDGVVVPRVESASEVIGLIDDLRHPPGGRRGFALRRAAGYGRRGVGDITCLIQIESREAIAAAPAIANLDGVDGLVVGTADLALDFGVPLDLRGDALREALETVRATAQGAGIAFGIAAGGDPQAIADAISVPPSMVVYSADVRLYVDALDAARRRLAEVFEAGAALTAEAD